jgi:hypothetical protein
MDAVYVFAWVLLHPQDASSDGCALLLLLVHSAECQDAWPLLLACVRVLTPECDFCNMAIYLHTLCVPPDPRPLYGPYTMLVLKQIAAWLRPAPVLWRQKTDALCHACHLSQVIACQSGKGVCHVCFCCLQYASIL